MEWVALHVLTGAEEDVAYSLHALPGLTALAPMERVTLLKGGKPRAKLRPVLPGYVLLNWEPDADLWHYIRKLGGVIRFLGGWPPSVIPEEEMGVMLALDAHCATYKPAPAIREDGRTRIVDGPLLPYGDRITSVNFRSMRAKLAIELPDGPHRATIGIELLEDKGHRQPDNGGG